jgi:predicted nucleic acid-binding protein
MIAYLDTSSLVKLYVQEQGTAEVKDLVHMSSVVSTSVVAYAEASAAFARKFRAEAFTEREYDEIKDSLQKDWKHYCLLKATDAVIREAGRLAEERALRGFDAIHLASACALRRRSFGDVKFSGYDVELNEAAVKEGFELWNGQT